MKLRRIAAVAVLALAGAGAASALGTGASVVVKAVPNAALSKTVLVTSGGLTLYHLTGEGAASIKCTAACAKTWPPLIVAKGAKVRAGAGIVPSALGIARRPDGRRQVTYLGRPLYRYAGDAKPGDAKGEGVGGTWFAVTPVGAAAPPPETTTGGGGDGGYYP